MPLTFIVKGEQSQDLTFKNNATCVKPKAHFLQAVGKLQGSSPFPFVNCAAFHHKGFTFLPFHIL